MIGVSAVLAVVEPISALMLASIVMRTHRHHGVPLTLRLALSALACGLLLHAAASVELISHYRPPRTYTWLGILFPLNAVIWLVYAWSKRHEAGLRNEGRYP